MSNIRNPVSDPKVYDGKSDNANKQESKRRQQQARSASSVEYARLSTTTTGRAAESAAVVAPDVGEGRYDSDPGHCVSLRAGILITSVV